MAEECPHTKTIAAMQKAMLDMQGQIKGAKWVVPGFAIALMGLLGVVWTLTGANLSRVEGTAQSNQIRVTALEATSVGQDERLKSNRDATEEVKTLIKESRKETQEVLREIQQEIRGLRRALPPARPPGDGS